MPRQDIFRYSQLIPCPKCGEDELRYIPGTRATLYDPPDPEEIWCDNCDWQPEDGWVIEDFLETNPNAIG